MSSKYICDRCKSEKSFYWTKITSNFNGTGDTESDVCYDCYSEFIIWIERRQG